MIVLEWLLLKTQVNLLALARFSCHLKVIKVNTSLVILLGTALFTSNPAKAKIETPSCSELSFIMVEPEKIASGTSNDKSLCKPNLDKNSCKIKKALASLSKVSIGGSGGNKEAILLKRVPGGSEELNNLAPLLNSRAVLAINQLRIYARAIAGVQNPCEPILIYVGKKEVFGLGPAFLGNVLFALEGQLFTSLTSVEDISIGGFSVLSKKSLKAHNYYDIVIAHELAHGLMMDAYGMDDEKLSKAIVSRDGHMASAITDPALAWLEGFAEGFETYFGEQQLDAAQFDFPIINNIAKTADGAAQLFKEFGWTGYIFGSLPTVFSNLGSTLLHLDDFLSEFLIAERQQPIRNNHYVLKGSFSNLTHQFGLSYLNTNTLELANELNWKTENSQAIYSKEGVVAYLIYEILKVGKHRKLVETLAASKPQNVYEFVQAFFPNPSTSPSNYRATPKILNQEALLRSIFTAEGRDLVSTALRNDQYLQSSAPRNEFLGLMNSSTKSFKLTPPRSLWIEFENISLAHKLNVGSTDRINLLTATPSRIEQFLRSALQQPFKEAVVTSIRDRRQHKHDTAAVSGPLGGFGLQSPPSTLSTERKKAAETAVDDLIDSIVDVFESAQDHNVDLPPSSTTDDTNLFINALRFSAQELAKSEKGKRNITFWIEIVIKQILISRDNFILNIK